MTETDPEKRLIGYARVSTYGQTLDTQLSRAYLRRRRGSGISRLTDPTAVAQLWLRAGSLCPLPTFIRPTEALLPRTDGRSMECKCVKRQRWATPAAVPSAG